MFDCDTVFARHGKFNRSALARLVTWDHLHGSTWQRTNLVKLCAHPAHYHDYTRGFRPLNLAIGHIE